MAKGYWVVGVTINDGEAYQKYIAANAEAMRKYQARFLVRAGTREVLEGSARDRVVVIEFPSYQMALDCYRSPEYSQARALRLDVSEGDVVIIEGYDGPQPDAS